MLLLSGLSVIYTVPLTVGVVRAALAYAGFRLWAWLAIAHFLVIWLAIVAVIAGLALG